MQRHQRLPIGEKLSELASCRTHPDEKLKHWCHRCNLLICSDCARFEHKDHSHALINVEAKEFEIKVRICCMW
jgi:hypothetical protein